MFLASHKVGGGSRRVLSLDQHFREMEQRCGDWNPKAETERGGGRGGSEGLEGGRGLALNGVWGA